MLAFFKSMISFIYYLSALRTQRNEALCPFCIIDIFATERDLSVLQADYRAVTTKHIGRNHTNQSGCIKSISIVVQGLLSNAK